MHKDVTDKPVIDVEAVGLANIPAIPHQLRVILRLALMLSAGTLTIEIPDGRRLRFQGEEPGPDAEIIIRNPTVAWQLLTGGHLGFAEAFLRGHWDSPNIPAFLELFARNREDLNRRLRGLPIISWPERLRHLLNRNSRSGSRKNIHYHYDLGNEFYRRWLDPSMTYSSAHFTRPDEDLTTAQINKYRRLAKSIGLERQHTLLEIGSG